MSDRPLARYGVVMGVCVIAGAIAGIVTSVFGDRGPAGSMTVAAATGLAMAAGLWACARWWRSLDEAAQEAHKWAWWWGSTFGMAVGGVALFTLVYTVDEILRGSPKDLFLSGVAFLVVFQTAGYGVAWAVWWLKRR